MTELRFRSCLHASLTEMATQAARGFEGYAVPVPADPDALARQIAAEQIDLSCSFQALRGHEVVGQTFVARRGRRLRIASMSVPTADRGRGIGRRMLRHAIEEGRSRGDAQVHLEVIRSNAPAVHLYEACGLRRVRALVGFDRPPLGEDAAPAPLPPYGDVLDLASLVAADDAYLPWQLQSATLLGTSAADVYRLGPALAQVTPREDVLHLRALAVPPSGRRGGHGRALVEALAAAYPRSTVRVLAKVPEGLAEEFMGAVGFVPSELSQWEMACRLDA